MSIWCTGSVSRMCTGYGIRGWRGRTGQTVIPFPVQHSAYWPGTNLTGCMLCWWCWCISSNIGHARLMLVLSFISCPGISMYCPPSISSFLIHLPPAHLEVADSRRLSYKLSLPKKLILKSTSRPIQPFYRIGFKKVDFWRISLL